MKSQNVFIQATWMNLLEGASKGGSIFLSLKKKGKVGKLEEL